MTFYQQNRLNPPDLNVILTLNIRTFQIRMYRILKTKLMASRKADLRREAGTNSKTWLLLNLHLVALRIAKAKKPHTIAEDLLLPAIKDIVSCSDLKFTS